MIGGQMFLKSQVQLTPKSWIIQRKNQRRYYPGLLKCALTLECLSQTFSAVVVLLLL